MNNKILSIQSGGNQQQARKILKTNLHFQRNTLCLLISQSTRVWSKLTSIYPAVEIVVVMEEGHMSSLMWLVTSVSRRYTSRKNACQTEMAPVGNHPRSTQMSFQNGLLRSLLFQIPKIIQQPPWTETARSTIGAPLSIMVMVYVTCSSPRYPLRSHYLVCSENHLFIVRIWPIHDKEL